MNSKALAFVVFVMAGSWFGCQSAERHRNWPVFYDDDGDSAHLLIPYAPRPADYYTNQIPNGIVPGTSQMRKSGPVKMITLGEVGGWQVVVVRFALTDIYYTDTQMILQEVEPGKFLPVYVQIFNHYIRWPSPDTVITENRKIIIDAGMDYEGTGHFHTHYKMIVSPDARPLVTESSRK